MEADTTISLSVCLLFLIAGSVADAAMDKMQFHFEKSIFADFKDQEFWNPAISWQSKWKEFPSDANPKGVEKFWGSSRWFVAFTDGWHCVQFFQLWCYATAAVSAVWVQPMGINNVIYFITMLFAARLIMSVTFSIFFDKVFVRKGNNGRQKNI